MHKPIFNLKAVQLYSISDGHAMQLKKLINCVNITDNESCLGKRLKCLAEILHYTKYFLNKLKRVVKRQIYFKRKYMGLY